MDLQAIRYDVDGRTFTGFLADGSRGREVPGILVAHEGPGVTAHIKARTRKLAELGTIAFALDLYGEIEPPIERAKEFVRALRADLPLLRRRTAAALDLLVAQPGVDSRRTAAVGFCFGGTAVLELARSGRDVGCIVGFHAGLDTTAPADARAIRGKVLACLGSEDPIVDAKQRADFAAEMTAGGVDWQISLYGGAGHSFTNRDIDAYGFPGFAYDARADARSWRAMCVLFDETWGTEYASGLAGLH